MTTIDNSNTKHLENETGQNILSVVVAHTVPKIRKTKQEKEGRKVAEDNDVDF